MEASRQLNDFLKVLEKKKKRKNNQHSVLYPEKKLFKNEGKTMILSDEY